MQKFSGLVLDRHDLPDEWNRYYGNVKPGYYELEKAAQQFTPEELACLPDETFAVILHDGDTTLRKFSMADAGNTGVSVVLFLENGHKLPVEAQKVAAANLVRGCECYGLEAPEELQKVALGLGTLVGATMVPGALQESKKNIAVSKGTGGVIVTPAQIKAQRMQNGV
jgi:hypothetical protein